MSEKRGLTVKLEYPFNTAGVLECYYPDSDVWYRTTASEFRAFDGRRRITEPEYVSRFNNNIPMITEEYFGPVYHLGTNTVVRSQGLNMIIGGTKWHEIYSPPSGKKVKKKIVS
jgi:hypothetical protein